MSSSKRKDKRHSLDDFTYANAAIKDRMSKREAASLCSECNGSDRIDDSKAQVGCNFCPRWYHRECINDFIDMSDKKVKRFDFYCKFCLKKRRLE